MPAGNIFVVAIITFIFAGLAVWLLNRRTKRQVLERMGATVRQMTSLIEHTDCLLWEASVELNDKSWKWEFTLHNSALSQKIFGERIPTSDEGLWGKFSIPERPEMDRRAREAMQGGQSSYEQTFRIERGGQMMWLHESVSVITTGPNRFRLVGLATDITEQCNAEHTNRKSQEQLQQLMSHANCMLWQASVRRDEKGEFHWDWFIPRSELYRRLAGDDVRGNAAMPWAASNVPEFDEIELRSHDAMQRGLPGYEQTFRLVQGNQVSWIHEQATITHLGPDHWKLEGVAINITAQKRAEDAQHSSEKRLEQLLERADCTIWQARVIKAENGKLHWNIYIPPSQLYRRIYGTDPKGANGFDWKKLAVPEYEEMLARCTKAILNNATGYEQTFHISRADHDLWLAEQVSISAAMEPDQWDLVGIITDVTARHEAEEARRSTDAQLQQVLELADCMVWQATVTLNPDDSFSWDIMTPRSVLYRRLFGEGTLERTVVLNWHRLNVPEIVEMERRFSQAFRNGSPGYEQVFRVISPRKVTWLHETVTLRPIKDGQVHLVGVITDVTMQREALEARRASEHQVQQILETADCLLWQATVVLSRMKLTWKVLIPPSRLYREVFGSDPQDNSGLEWNKVIDPLTSAEIDGRAENAIRSGAPGYEQEFRAQREDRVFWLHEQVAITQVSEFEWKLVGVITDLSARREAEQSVRASEIRYRSLFQHTPVAIVETDFQPVGLWLDELRASGVTNLSNWLDEEPRRLHEAAKRMRVSNTNETAMQILRAKKPSDFRRRRGVLATPDSMLVIRATLLALWGGRNTLEAQLDMRDFEGGLHHMSVRWWVAQTESGLDLSQSLLVFVDLTELKQAEAALATEKERLAVTLRAMTEGVVTTDVAGIIQFMNPAAAALTEWDTDAIGQSVVKICALEHEQRNNAFDFPVGSSARSDSVLVLPPQTRLVTRTGARRLIDGCCAPIHSAESKVIGMVFVFRDVTEHERLEQEVVRSTRLESVGILAGGIAHDFNNILTGVMGNLALAQLDIEAKSEAGIRLAEAEKATLRARDLTQQLLTFAKGGEPVRAAVRLDAIVRETATFALHGSSVKPIFHLAPDLWRADADKGQIGRVVQNLVINAIQAMPNGGTLRLTAQNETVTKINHPDFPPGNYVQIVIADTGEGIKAADLPRIFDPYFTTKQTGSGLGLAAVYSIIKKHLGHIDVESVIGTGTTFRLWLPAMSEAGSNTVAPMPLAGASFTGRVLFMDDEESICRMASLMLQRLGFEVVTTIDGAEAVAKFRAARAAANPFDVIIMDLTVPGGMGGREAVMQLQGIDPHVKAIVSSGYSSDPVLANHRAHGFCGVIAKPYRLDDVVMALRTALAERVS